MSHSHILACGTTMLVFAAAANGCGSKTNLGQDRRDASITGGSGVAGSGTGGSGAGGAATQDAATGPDAARDAPVVETGGVIGTGNALGADATIKPDVVAGTGGIVGSGGKGAGGTAGADARGGSGGRGGAGGSSLKTDGPAGGGMGGAGGTASGGAPGLDAGRPDAPLAKCGDVTTLAECEARSDCHSVFVDPGDCGCATLGCCTRFESCADGDKAKCTGTVLCEVDPPRCEGSYVVSYQGSCYEGCVKQTDCALLACPQAPPANGAACGPVPVSQTCYYEDCAGAGRTVATCAAGASAWQVTTGACAPYACAADASSSSLICPSGMICVLTTQIGPVAPIPTPACVPHSCGTGPITPECVPGLYGTCAAAYSVGGVVFRCEVVSDCGDRPCA
jgi:hypothetical protein